MTGFSIKVASISDIHMAHLRTPTTLITENLRRAFADNPETASLDLIVLAGDVFDRMMQVPEDDVYIARAWVYHFLCVCAKHHIVVRVLEGTPRHDRRQSAMFQEVIDLTGLELDFKYVDTLSIEHIKSLDVQVLYVPDEWRHTPQETLAEVRALMAERMLTQVDFAVMHGCFEYQLPPLEKLRAKAHSSADYLALVRYQIFIGHHHVFSQYKHIVAQGSFDRLNHGEEAPKGHVRLTIRDGVKSLVFVENTGAMDYRTISVAGLPVEEVHSLIRGLNLREGSYLQLTGSPSDPGIKMLRLLRQDYPQYRLTAKPEHEVKKETTSFAVERRYVPAQIGPTNLAGMARDWLLRAGVDESEVADCEGYLNEQIKLRTGQAGPGSVSPVGRDLVSH